MRKVHWSVWGLLGFFGMLLVGLWIDSYWLPGVGFLTPVTVVAPPMAVTPVQGRLMTPDDDQPIDDCQPGDAEAGAASEGKAVTVDLTAPGLLGGLEISTDEPAAELLPEPETTDILPASIDEALDTWESEFLEPPSPSSPPGVGADKPPARNPVAQSNTRPQTPAPPSPGPDRPDPQVSA